MAVSASNMAEFKMAAIIKLSQNEWVKFFLCKMAESKMAEFKMAAIIKLSQNEWVKFFLCKMAESKMADFKIAAIIKLSQNEWLKFFMCKCWEIILAGVSEFERRNYDGWKQNGQIQDGRIQDGCHHQVESEWMSYFLCRMAESKMAEFKMEEFNLAAIIKLITLNYFESESEWGKSVFEWIWEKITRCLNPRWQCLNPTWQNSRWPPSSSWVSMNDFESDWISWSQSFEQNGWIQDIRI